ncbi:MAG: glycosyltransferase [Methanosphaera sp.]|nr:glycosyltransferase [Methanosphaera sp.]
MTKVSVIIPVYNAEEFLTESIDSIKNQSLIDIEIICVNDGSTDNSLTMLNNMAKKDGRIVVIDKDNGGCGSARNRGLSYANGEYCYFFDPDDYVLPDALEKLYENACNNNSDIVLSQIAWYKEGHTINYNKPGYNIQEVFPDENFNDFTFDYHDVKEYVLNSYYAPWTKLYKKSFLDRNEFKFDENIAFDDVPFHVKTLLKADKISFIKKAFYHYRTTNKKSVNNTVTNAVDIMRICDIVEEYLKENDYYNDFIAEFNHFKVTQILLYIIFSNSECYYKYAKNEFIKMNVSKEHLPESLYENYRLVLSTNSYNEYRIKSNAPPIPNKNQEYLEKIKKLENKIDSLNKNNDELIKQKNNNIKEKNQIKVEYDDLKQKHDIILNKHKQLEEESEKIKKINEDILSSKTWRINRLMHKIIAMFKFGNK